MYDNVSDFDTLFGLGENLDYLQKYAEANKATDITNEAFASFNLEVENSMSVNINKRYGHININLDKDVSDILCDKQINSISMSDFDNLPFKSFILNLEHLSLIGNVLVVKKDNKLNLHFNSIGIEGINLQIVAKNNQRVTQKTFSSFLYEKHIDKISHDTYELLNRYFSYTIATILYIINFNDNKEAIVKHMHYDYFINRLKPSQLKKPKYQKKAANKENKITLKLPSKQLKYLNSEDKGTKYTKCTTPFLVIGYWRNQRVGKRSEGKTKLIWIKPFFKCTGYKNNIDFIPKFYEVS